LAELVAEGLTKNFNGFRAVDDVSFKLEGTGCYGYLGPNGAGKTTTMKLFTSLLRPSKGKALVNGFEVSKHPTKALKSVGSLIEDPEPYNFMTVQEFIEFAVKIRDENRKPDLAHLNEMLDLPPMDRKCAKLSKGQKRRVYIAALVAQDPEILILDEPSAGLDPAESVVFRNMIIQLKKDRTVLLSSHLLYEVTQVCDSVLFINKGKIVESGTVQEISKKFASKSLRVEFSVPVDESKVRGLQEMGLLTGYGKENDRLYALDFDGKEETRQAIVAEVYRLGLRSIQDAQLSLEQAYLDLVK
jgi:ABC-2 type transport system ATP-binding protein